MLVYHQEDIAAIDILKGILQESPKNEPAIELLIDSLRNTEQYKKAHKWVDRLQKIDPDNIDYQLEEARLLRT